MRRGSGCSALVVLLSVVPTVAQAGWVSQWTNTAKKPDGSQLNAQVSTMAIADGQVRIDQPDVITVIDYNGGHFTLMNPARQAYWTGTIDDYTRTLARDRLETMLQKMGGMTKKNPKVAKAEAASKASNEPLPTPDASKLPPITITKTNVSEKIAGYDTVKYEFRAGGDLFEEVWIAPTLDVSSDLGPAKYFAAQRKLGSSMTGKAGDQYNALYDNEDYRKLVEKGFILKMVNHHSAGSFERVASSMQQTTFPANEFDVPATYRKVALSDVFPTPPPASTPTAHPPAAHH